MTARQLIASGFGAGYAPAAPGTVGSVVGLLLGALLFTDGYPFLLLGIAVVSLAGYWAVHLSGEAAHDPGWVVIDEVAGQMIAMSALTRISLPGLLLAFALFRLLDIAKPGPIGWADRRADALGVMGDDWIAGALAALVILLLRLVLLGHRV